jgi:hypothetical protein
MDRKALSNYTGEEISAPLNPRKAATDRAGDLTVSDAHDIRAIENKCVVLHRNE